MGFLTSKLVRWHLYSCGFHERTISEEIPQPSDTKINLKITSPKFLSNLLGANDFINSILGWRVIRLQKPYSATAQVPDQYYILISAAVCSLNAHWGCVASFDLNEHELTWHCLGRQAPCRDVFCEAWYKGCGRGGWDMCYYKDTRVHAEIYMKPKFIDVRRRDV